MTRGLVLLVAVMLLAAGLARAQGQDSCEIQRVSVEPTSNGLRVRIAASGLLKLSVDPDDYRWWQYPRITFKLNNVRAGADPMVPIGQYPVSHLEFGVPDGGRTAGLLCTIALFQPGRLTVFDGSPYGWDDTSWAPRDVPQVMINLTQQQNEVLILITSDQPMYEPAPREYQPSPPSLAITGTPERVMLHAVNADLSQVAEALSQLAGLPIMVADEAPRTISAHLQGLPLLRTLEMLARGNGLALAPRDDGYVLVPALSPSASAYGVATTRTVPLRYLAPEDAPRLLPAPLLSAVRPHADAHAVTISGPPVLLDKVEQDLRVLDQPSRHCQLRAWVISTEHADQATREFVAHLTGGNTGVKMSSTEGIRVESGGRKAEEILAQVEALAQRGKLHVESVPAMMVLNGEEGRLFVGEQIYYWRNEDLASLQAGTLLRFTPRAFDGGAVVGLRVENNFLAGANVLGPIVQRRTAETTVYLHAGESVVIGGLQQASGEQNRHQPPLLPGAGAQRVTETREVVVIVKALIL